jgi:AcrR family transcriptional regulator
MARSIGRPRGDDEHILEAALLEYGAHGASGFTLNGVARRAGVGKSALYLRWPDKDSLLADAVATRSAGIEAVDSGSLREDLTTLATNLATYWREPAGWATLRITVDQVGAAEPPAFHQHVIDGHRTTARSIVERAVARGELTAHAQGHGPLALQLLYGGVLMRLLSREPVDRACAEQIVDGVLATLAPITD